ncbi:Pre-SET motif family protein [Carpediemonas membranifera]|uniref:Pre-SET motif family protein n=1 Tax=Carpediemonas membranifera TaxID=201153 RepID=A0A8J6AS15_9EUKA|nr:Pre-SET motif family protein [Carpediemonas membranifera]|eukprot:KAG9390015.1 Pre-SET motif family protein [Carpediemonas membranifera]
MRLNTKETYTMPSDDYCRLYSSKIFTEFSTDCSAFGFLRSMLANKCDINVDENGFSTAVSVTQEEQYSLMGTSVGNGVMVMSPIEKGTIIGAYRGEIVSTPGPTADSTYVMSFSQKLEYHVDSSGLQYGCHLINDGMGFYNCDALTYLVSVMVDDKAVKLPILVIAATADIKPMEFLSIEYGDDYWRGKKRVTLFPFSMGRMCSATTSREEMEAVVDNVLGL